jgi:hypothetical protein
MLPTTNMDKASQKNPRRKPGPKPGLPKIDILAVAFLSQHPDWTPSQIAAKVGCHVNSLYRSKFFTLAIARLQQAQTGNLPAGSKIDGVMEAW